MIATNCKELNVAADISQISLLPNACMSSSTLAETQGETGEDEEEEGKTTRASEG